MRLVLIAALVGLIAGPAGAQSGTYNSSPGFGRGGSAGFGRHAPVPPQPKPSLPGYPKPAYSKPKVRDSITPIPSIPAGPSSPAYEPYKPWKPTQPPSVYGPGGPTTRR
ncbi:hypothetical protein [Phenylobacterium sp.]|jgi:DNA polymerase-3 subunit gamma/tau|uniref:hypothetical protein n=1 Tax=Phenylobacterium sp. TaxID=1871053 RepID=UPI0037840BAC